MTDCIHISKIEQAALNQVRGSDVPEDLSIHFDSCTFCRELFEGFVREHSETEKQFNSFPEPMIDALLESSGDDVSSKYSFIAEVSEFGRLSAGRGGFQLLTRAADNATSVKKPRYENCGVLATNNGDILIRLMRNTDTGILHLHLIAEDEDKYKHVLVRIEPGGLELFSDDLGRVGLENVDLPNLQSLKIIVSTPRAVFDLEQIGSDWKEFIGKGEIHLRNSENELLFVEFTPEGESYCLTVRLEKAQLSDGSQRISVLANKEGHALRSQPVDKGLAVFHEINDIPSLRVKVFG